MIERFWTPGPQARLLPAENLHVPTVAVMGIMTFAMVLVACAGLAIANGAAVVATGSASRYVVEIPSTSTDRLPAALAAIRSDPAVAAATAVPEAEMRETLSRWLGEAADSADLPVPALIMVDTRPGANLAGVAARARSAAPGSRTTAQSAELRPLLRSLRALQWLALALVALMAVASSAAIVLAARGALDTHRSTIDIMHGIGATDAQVTRLFERKIAVDVAIGAFGGAVAAALALLLLGGGMAALAGELAATAPLAPVDYLILAAIPVAAIGLALGVAHLTLLRALRTAI